MKNSKAKIRQNIQNSKRQPNLHDNIDLNGNFNVPTSVSMPPDMVGFPDRFGTVLKYVQQNALSNATPSPPAQVFNLNSCYDPDNTGGGHQPSYWDVLTLIYSRYYVAATKMDVEFSNYSTTRGIIGAVSYSDANIATDTTLQQREGKYTKRINLGCLTARSTGMVRMPWMTTSRIMGMKFTEADDNMYAGVGSNPSDLSFGIIRVISDDVTDNANVSIITTIYFKVFMKDLLPKYSSLAKRIKGVKRDKEVLKELVQILQDEDNVETKI